MNGDAEAGRAPEPKPASRPEPGLGQEPEPRTPEEVLAEEDPGDPDVGADGTGVGELP
jgi:hypothetical protein